MTKFQLIYNGHPCFPLCDTREEAEVFKQKSAAQSPYLSVVIKEVNTDGEDIDAAEYSMRPYR